MAVVTENGPGVPARDLRRKVATHRSLQPDLPFLGSGTRPPSFRISPACRFWLPEHVDPRDCCGSLVNVVTAYVFLEPWSA